MNNTWVGNNFINVLELIQPKKNQNVYFLLLVNYSRSQLFKKDYDEKLGCQGQVDGIGNDQAQRFHQDNQDKEKDESLQIHWS